MIDEFAIRPTRPATALRIFAAVLVLALGGSLLSSLNADAAKRQRVVSISPFATEVLAKVGVRPVAIGQVLSETDRTPRKFRGVRVLPLSHPNGPNLEELAKIRPTMVISSTRWRRGTSAMKQLGIRVMYADPVKLGQTYGAVRSIGRAVGRSGQANRLVRTMRRQVSAATRGITNHPRVMGILGVGRKPQFFLGNSWGGQMIRLAGGVLLTGGATNPGGFAPISDEVVVAQDPQVIIGVPHGSVTDMGAAFEYILKNPAWQTVRAIQDGMVKGSFDNRLLQAGVDVGKTIRIVRRCLASSSPVCE